MTRGMKMDDAMIAWTPACLKPAGDGLPKLVPGSIKVGARASCSEWASAFTSWEYAGRFGINSDSRNAPAERLGMLFRCFHTIVVRDGIDPRATHREFMNIAEYRDCISADFRADMGDSLAD